jgi:hypothetical protein
MRSSKLARRLLRNHARYRGRNDLTIVEVADRNVGVLESLAAQGGQQDLAGLAACLEAVKRRYPDQSAATLLVAEDVDYDTIVQVMDAMRLRQVIDGGKVASTELFPQIALGDAPT